jgi:hypothetical protein
MTWWKMGSTVVYPIKMKVQYVVTIKPSVNLVEYGYYTVVAENMGFLPTNHHMTHQHFKKNTQI